MKYIILLLLVTACSSTKVTPMKVETLKTRYKNQTERYFQKKKMNQRQQLAYI